MRLNKYLCTAMLMLPLLACERDLNLDEYRNTDIENMLVVNSILNPDSVIGVSVTHPYFFSDTHTTFKPVESLDVQIRRGDKDWEPLAFDKRSGLYVSSHRPVEGEAVSLRVEGRHQNACTCDTIPYKVDIADVKVSGEGPIPIYWEKDYRFVYKITFCDTPSEENYYFLAIESDALSYEFTQMGQVDYTGDYVFRVLADEINRDIKGWRPTGVFGYPFSDKGIDGERYTLTVSEVLQNPWTERIKTLPRRVKLYSISRAYYDYMVSVLSMDYDESALKGSLLTLGLVEPVKIYSNIDGGAGLFGCYSLSTVKLDLLQHTGGWPNNE